MQDELLQLTHSIAYNAVSKQCLPRHNRKPNHYENFQWDCAGTGSLYPWVSHRNPWGSVVCPQVPMVK